MSLSIRLDILCKIGKDENISVFSKFTKIASKTEQLSTINCISDSFLTNGLYDIIWSKSDIKLNDWIGENWKIFWDNFRNQFEHEVMVIKRITDNNNCEYVWFSFDNIYDEPCDGLSLAEIIKRSNLL